MAYICPLYTGVWPVLSNLVSFALLSLWSRSQFKIIRPLFSLSLILFHSPSNIPSGKLSIESLVTSSLATLSTYSTLVRCHGVQCHTSCSLSNLLSKSSGINIVFPFIESSKYVCSVSSKTDILVITMLQCPENRWQIRDNLLSNANVLYCIDISSSYDTNKTINHRFDLYLQP